MKFTTFAFPTMVNRVNGKTQFSTDMKSINECVGILLRTRPGELMGEPEYGCNLINRIHQYNGVILPDLCKEDIMNAISRWEPRCLVGEGDIHIEQQGRYVNIYITYTDVTTGTVEEFQVSLDSTTDTTFY
mgnify:CR=1 FL=1